MLIIAHGSRGPSRVKVPLASRSCELHPGLSSPARRADLAPEAPALSPTPAPPNPQPGVAAPQAPRLCSSSPLETSPTPPRVRRRGRHRPEPNAGASGAGPDGLEEGTDTTSGAAELAHVLSLPGLIYPVGGLAMVGPRSGGGSIDLLVPAVAGRERSPGVRGRLQGGLPRGCLRGHTGEPLCWCRSFAHLTSPPRGVGAVTRGGQC